MRLIGLMGFARTGKDTVAEILVRNYGFTRVGFADGVREFALAVDPWVDIVDSTAIVRLSAIVGEVGWEKAKENPEVRRILQMTGTEGGRKVFGPDAWVDAAFQKILDLGVPDTVIPDTRFISEARGIRDRGGVVWRVTRPGYGPLNDHPSETEQITVNEDGVIVNDGDLSALEEHVGLLMQSFFEESK